MIALNQLNTVEEILRNLTEKQYKFYLNVISANSDSISDIVSAYHNAGFVKTKTSKYAAKQLYYSDRFQKLIKNYRQNTIEKIENKSLSVFEHADQGLLWSYEEAKEKRDYMAVRQILMDRAKLHNLLADRTIISTDDNYSLDANIRKQAMLQAEQMLLGQLPQGDDNGTESGVEGDTSDSQGDDDNIIDAAFTDDTELDMDDTLDSSAADDDIDDSESFLDN